MLSCAEVDRFWQQGFLGPFRCGCAPPANLLKTLSDQARVATVKDSLGVSGGEEASSLNWINGHWHNATLLALAMNPAIVGRVAALFGGMDVCLVRSQYVYRQGGHSRVIPWHQDVGVVWSGVYPDHSPVPTITARLILDSSHTGTEALHVLPGTQKILIGEWRAGFYGIDRSFPGLAVADVPGSHILSADPGGFHLFHSWLVHANTDQIEHSYQALVLRFVAAADVAFVPGRTLRLQAPAVMAPAKSL